MTDDEAADASDGCRITDEDLAAQVHAAAAELAAGLRKPPTAWQIAARAVQLGAPYERRTDILRLAQALAAPPAPPAAARPRTAPRTKEVRAREMACRERAALLVEAARALDEMADALDEQCDALDEDEVGEFQHLLRKSARFNRLAEVVSEAAGDLGADRGEA